MKEIGLKLKNKREENGISIEEVSEDLKVRPSQIISLEEGKKEDFKDVSVLKYFIRDYSKYLGLDGDEIVDEFNEFLFDFTSKIPIDDINKAREKKTNKKEVISPYTMDKKDNNSIKFIIGAFILIILLVLGYVVISNIKGNEFKNDDRAYVILRR